MGPVYFQVYQKMNMLDMIKQMYSWGLILNKLYRHETVKETMGSVTEYKIGSVSAKITQKVIDKMNAILIDPEQHHITYNETKILLFIAKEMHIVCLLTKDENYTYEINVVQAAHGGYQVEVSPKRRM